MSLDLDAATDGVLTSDVHLVQSFTDLNALKQDGARTTIFELEGVCVTDSEGNRAIDGTGDLWCVNAGPPSLARSRNSWNRWIFISPSTGFPPSGGNGGVGEYCALIPPHSERE